MGGASLARLRNSNCVKGPQEDFIQTMGTFLPVELTRFLRLHIMSRFQCLSVAKIHKKERPSCRLHSSSPQI